jgi:hypothetical protein
MLETLVADVRYALRWLARSPGFTAVAVASFAIGIGFNTALFTLVDALLFRPLPVARADRLVDIYTSAGDGDTFATSSYPDYLDFKAQTPVLADVLGYSPSIAAVNLEDRSRLAMGEVVTGNYFSLLGVNAALGRTLLPDDDRPGAARVVVLSHRLWATGYSADPAVIGRTLRIHGQPYTIVGVAPREFTGMLPILAPELWTAVAHVDDVEPAGMQDTVPSPGAHRLERRGQRWLFLKARLKPDATVPQAAAGVDAVMSGSRPNTRRATRTGGSASCPRAACTCTRCRPHAASSCGRADGGRRPGAADRMRQRRQHAAGPRVRAAQGDRRAARDRRQPRPPAAAAPDREPPGRVGRRRRGRGAGVGVGARRPRSHAADPDPAQLRPADRRAACSSLRPS